MSPAFDLVNIWFGTTYFYASLMSDHRGIVLRSYLVLEICVLFPLVHLHLFVISMNKSIGFSRCISNYFLGNYMMRHQNLAGNLVVKFRMMRHQLRLRNSL